MYFRVSEEVSNITLIKDTSYGASFHLVFSPGVYSEDVLGWVDINGENNARLARLNGDHITGVLCA